MSTTKTKKRIPTSRKSIPIVKSFSNLEVGRIYKTKDYGIFNPLEYNRGETTGWQRKRVAKITKLIDSDKFYMEVCHVLVNLKGDAIDGNNRLQALKERGKYVNFMLTAQHQFNLSNDSEILNNVSDFNAINSSWSETDAFNSALQCLEASALEVEDVRNKVKNLGQPLRAFTASRIVGIALQDATMINSKKQPRRMYCGNKIKNLILTDKFWEDFDTIVQIMNFANTSLGKDRWYAVKAMMPYIWNDNVNKDKFLSVMKKTGFGGLPNNTAGDTADRVYDFIEELIPKKR